MKYRRPERRRGEVDWRVWPLCTTLAAVAAFTLWLSGGEARSVTVALRLPGKDLEAEQLALQSKKTQKMNPGTLIAGTGQPSEDTGSWPQFRGLERDGIVHESGPLLRDWPAAGLRKLWQVAVGEGHAGAVIHKGRVYLIDYDREKQEDAIRCLSLADGREIWRFTYYVKVKRNHGMSRTVPAVNDDFVVALGPLCHVTCLNSATGERLWQMDLVKECGTTVPEWYAGQCPLIDGDRVILAPGGNPLMMAVEGKTGKVLWRTPNPGGWGMTHTSIVPMDYRGRRTYVYSSTLGVVGVSADDGRILWKKPDWRIAIAAIASPVVVPPDRVFLSGGYGIGCAMIRLKPAGDEIAVEEVFRRDAEVFGSPQHTPILYEGRLYGVVPNGELACLDLEGNRVWSSGSDRTFGLGPLTIADGLLLALNDQQGALSAAEVPAHGYKEAARTQVLSGHDAWAPMALADGRLIVRDLTTMVCLEIGKRR